MSYIKLVGKDKELIVKVINVVVVDFKKVIENKKN